MATTDTLIKVLEANAAMGALRLVEALGGRQPEPYGRPFGRGALIALGAGRYVNRAMGITLDELSHGDIDTVEQFFVGLDLEPSIEVSDCGPEGNGHRLEARGYTAQWQRVMLARGPEPAAVASADGGVRIEPVSAATRRIWLDVLARGNLVDGAAARAVSDEFALANSSLPGSHDYLAWIGDQPVGTGSIQVHDDVAWLGGAATVPSYRSRGVQTALLRHRLRQTMNLGCEIVAATAMADGVSARNLVRAGFTMLQTQSVLTRL